jgi:hypothetical protein
MLVCPVGYTVRKLPLVGCTSVTFTATAVALLGAPVATVIDWPPLGALRVAFADGRFSDEQKLGAGETPQRVSARREGLTGVNREPEVPGAVKYPSTSTTKSALPESLYKVTSPLVPIPTITCDAIVSPATQFWLEVSGLGALLVGYTERKLDELVSVVVTLSTAAVADEGMLSTPATWTWIFPPGPTVARLELALGRFSLEQKLGGDDTPQRVSAIRTGLMAV